MVPLKETRRESVTSLLDGENLGGTYSFTDWLGRPADDRHDLGGWSCSLCVLGAYLLANSALYGIMGNLALYLVEAWDESNATAAGTVTNLFGTILCCSFLGAFISDSYTGRFWGFVIFEILLVLSFLFTSSVGTLLGYGQSSHHPASRTLLLGLFYLMAVASGACFPSLASLGADQLRLHHEKARYFTLFSTTSSAGQIFAFTVITYVDGRELWVLGFWLCTAATAAAFVLTPCIARKCRVNRAGGNPLVRVGQVLVSAARNRNVSLPKDPLLLHEVQGELSAIPGCRKLLHTASLSCVDKAAVRTEDGKRAGPWRLCTVTQVEEVKCLIRVMPVGLASSCVGTALAQVSSLFEVQAAATNRKLVGGLIIAPASMQLFYIAGAILTGFLCNTISACQRRSFRHNQGTCTSLQLQGMAMLVGIIAMAVAALVEAHRLHVAHLCGSLISVYWLVPQNFLLGISMNLLSSGGGDFFYKEVSDGMRTMSLSLGLFFIGVGNYLSSIFVLLVTTVTTVGGRSGWIPDDLNDGHLDYFYWLLASFLTLAFGLFLLGSFFYAYRDIDSYGTMVLNMENEQGSLIPTSP